MASVTAASRPRLFRHRPLLAAALLVLAGALVVPGRAFAAPAPEYQLKAVFLFRISQFVEWPSQAFAADQAPLTICVLGEDPFGRYLDDTVSGEAANGHPMQVLRLRRVDESQACHILFVSDSELGSVGTILQALKARHVLTVSNGIPFVRRGGIVGFMLADGKVRLWINPVAASTAGLKLSSKLLRSAELVDAEEGADAHP